MNSLFRPLRSTFNRGPLAARHRLATRPVLWNTPLHARMVANSVGLKPGSEDFEHARQNIREEAGNTAKDLAKAIAGANVYGDGVKDGFVGITGAVASQVPKPVLMFGLAVQVVFPTLAPQPPPFYLAHEAGIAAAGLAPHIDPGVAITILDQALTVQMTYGAVMLSFLGALHWGMEFAEFGGRKGYSRLALGAAPVLFAWPTLVLDPTMALAAQWCGFTALWYADSQVTGLGSYLRLTILGSLAGITYWGPVGGHGLLSHDLELIRETRRSLYKNPEVKFGSEVVILQGEDTFTHLRKREDIEREQAEKEGKQQGKQQEGKPQEEGK
ncbi:hypothetical protein C8J57DRAFT_1287642 [Mycena rebaudengoi]|nr:hypothetical protein C8J57DRAFT_1287642 [Mycena rebaudengoi]